MERETGHGAMDTDLSIGFRKYIVKHIFVLSHRSLFSEGLELLFRQDEEMELVGIESDAVQALERIRVLGPDVVLLEQDVDPGAIVLRILSEKPTTKVVGINLAENTIRVYRCEQRTPREIRDLLEVMKSDPGQDEPVDS